jgi:hypothetical protein
MTKQEILKRLKKWEYDWINYLPLDGTHEFMQAGNLIKGYTLKRLSSLIREIEG